MFGLGVALGAGGFIPQWLLPKGITMTILCILVFQVGLSIGSNDKFKDMIRGFRPGMLLLPLFTIAGTLLFSVLASLFISGRSTADCLAVGSGFAYYSLSSVLITELKKRLSRSADCHRTWHACTARKHRKRSGLATRSPLILEVFRQICPYISRRYQLDGRTPAIH